MKIAVYSICKNEAKFAKRCLASVADADYIVIGDTGSTDGTLDALRAASSQARLYSIAIQPWRFDDARNAVLALVPADTTICVKMDLDETMQPGWKDKILNAWQPQTTRLKYMFHDGFVNGVSHNRYPKSDIHARSGYQWKYPCHETLCYVGSATEVISSADDLAIEHHQDHTKGRGSYLPLLELAVRESNNPRHIFWLGREYMYSNSYEQCIETMQRVLAIHDMWDIERAWAARFISRAYDALQQPTQAFAWALRFASEASRQREPWVWLGDLYHRRHAWAECYGVLRQALAITKRPDHYLSDKHVWGAGPHDMAALAAWKLSLIPAAEQHIIDAVQIEPGNTNLRRSAQRLGITITEEPNGQLRFEKAEKICTHP